MVTAYLDKNLRATALDEKVRGGVLIERLEEGVWVEEGRATLYFNEAPGWGWVFDFEESAQGRPSRPAYVRLMLGGRLAKLLDLPGAMIGEG